MKPADEQYLDVKEVARRYSIAKSTIWLMVADGRLPAPIRFSARITRWPLSALITHEQQLADSA